MSLLSQIQAAQKSKISAVTNSVEFQRIFALPRRELNIDTAVAEIGNYFRQPGSPHNLWPIQAAALLEAAQQNGLFAPIKVGGGKTLICLALPEVLDSQSAVLLVKPQLRDQLREEIAGFYSKHFRLPIDRITVVAYSELSAQSGAFVLDRVNPDLIIADEAHCLRHRSAARTKRFLRYMKEHPECRFCALSGTMTNRSVLEYAHLISLALREGSPLPGGYRELQDWSGVLDVDPEEPRHPGRLMLFCKPGETPREGFRRRLIETPGVVATGAEEIGTSLVFQRLVFDHPMHDVINEVLRDWEYDTEVFTEALQMYRFLRQVSLGFYYRWVWPGGKPDEEWLNARKEWNREVRDYLKRSRPGLDSPGLLEKAAESGEWKSKTWPRWVLVKDRPLPPTEAVWLNQFVFAPVLAWIRSIEEKRGIIWYSHQAVGTYLSDVCDLPLYDPSKDPRNATEQVILVSLPAHGDGKNLQHFSRQLFLSLPSNGTVVEQAVGRSHRPGQLDDEVEVSWFGHTFPMVAAYEQVLKDARYVEETQGMSQKVLYASRVTRKI